MDRSRILGDIDGMAITELQLRTLAKLTATDPGWRSYGRGARAHIQALVQAGLVIAKLYPAKDRNGAQDLYARITPKGIDTVGRLTRRD